MIGAVATRDNTAGDGYSLIELLTVLAVVAVLTTLAVPSYQHVVSKVRRAEGRTALLRLMQQQEQIYTQRMRYVSMGRLPLTSKPSAARFGSSGST